MQKIGVNIRLLPLLIFGVNCTFQSLLHFVILSHPSHVLITNISSRNTLPCFEIWGIYVFQKNSFPLNKSIEYGISEQAIAFISMSLVTRCA